MPALSCHLNENTHSLLTPRTTDLPTLIRAPFSGLGQEQTNTLDYTTSVTENNVQKSEVTEDQSLPVFQPAKEIPATISWGSFKGQEITDQLHVMYNRIVSWKRNIFKIPSGALGKAFIGEITRLLDLWINKTSMESIAFLALNVFTAIMLQKPSKTSKNRDHIKYLGERLEKWKAGKFKKLLSECEAIQKRIPKNTQQKNQTHVAKVFTRLMLQGKVAAALRWITDNNSQPLEISPEVVKKLKTKHPDAAPLATGVLKKDKVPIVEPVIFENIDAELVYKAAKITKGACGPSGLDSDTWRRILCSKSFGKSSSDACDSIARACRRLCTENVDPQPIAPLLNCRLIPLDKNPGIRPIGIGEVLRRIMGKTVVMFLKPEIINSVGPLQLSAGQEGGCEAACHAMSDIFAEDDCQGVLLVDATNAFNSLNRQTALHNIRHTCPEFATYLINTYRNPSKLFLPDGNHLLSKEGTTQGDNCASGFYSISTLMLLQELSLIVGCKNIWYADDGGAGGYLESLKAWWDKLLIIGPPIGYFPNATKTWLVVKQEHLDKARELFDGTGIQITQEGTGDKSGGQRYLGAAIGTQSFIKQYVQDKVAKWVTELEELCKIALTEPQLAYSAYITGLSKRWTYVMRTIPNIADLFAPLEACIRSSFLPIIVGNHAFTNTDRDIYSLPTRFGGLAVSNPVEMCPLEYSLSRKATQPLTEAILNQKLTLSPEETHEMNQKIKHAKNGISSEKTLYNKYKLASIKAKCTDDISRNLDILCQKGASSWLTALPLEEFHYTLSKQEFTDAVLMRYKHPIRDRPQICACSKANTIDHALSCAMGGYRDMRHNQIRDLEASLLEEVCKDVRTEPKLLPLTGETFKLKTTNTRPDARLDITARGVWNTMDKTFFDVRVFHDGNKSNSGPIDKVFQKHEAEKKRTYNSRVLEVEKSTFTPLVFSTSGSMGKEAEAFHKRIATLISNKRGTPYSDTISHIRRKLRFSILRTTLAAIRGHRGRAVQWCDDTNSDINLIPGWTSNMC